MHTYLCLLATLRNSKGASQHDAASIRTRNTISAALATVNVECDLRRAVQSIKRDHPGAKVEGLHLDYMNGMGCEY